MGIVVNPIATQGASAVGGTGTSAKTFTYAAQPFAPSGAGLTGNVTLGVPGSGRFNGKKFIIRFAGYVAVAGTSPTVQIQLLGATTGSTSYSTVAQSGTTSLTTGATYPFMLEAEVEGDSTSGILSGWFTSMVDTTVVIPATTGLTNALTSVNFGSQNNEYSTVAGLTTGSDEPCLTFQVAVVFGVSNSSNSATLTQFCMISLD